MLRGIILRSFIVLYYFSMILMIVAHVIPDSKIKNITEILRYGHQRVHDCPSREKSYVCIMKCLEMGSQIAQSNKECECKCFKDAAKTKYYGQVTKGWTVPTTSLPAWAVDSSSKNYVQLMGHVKNPKDGINSGEHTATGQYSAAGEVTPEEGNPLPQESISDVTEKDSPGTPEEGNPLPHESSSNVITEKAESISSDTSKTTIGDTDVLNNNKTRISRATEAGTTAEDKLLNTNGATNMVTEVNTAANTDADTAGRRK